MTREFAQKVWGLHSVRISEDEKCSGNRSQKGKKSGKNRGKSLSEGARATELNFIFVS